MQEKPSDTTIARQVELAVLRLDSLSALGNILISTLKELNQYRLSPSSLTELIECEPALAAQIIRTQQKKEGREFSFSSISETIEQLPLRVLRESLLSVSAYPADDENAKRLEFRTGLVRHCVAVGCCARLIVEVTTSDVDAEIAYAAGLLHDIGKLALDEIMPRSFIRLVEEARAQAVSIFEVERKFFGIDHTITGKRLAEKWHLPSRIVSAIWLHHSDTAAISEIMPDFNLAQVIQLADIMARLCERGQSGSFDLPVIPQQLLERLSIKQAHLEQIYHDLPKAVEDKLQLLSTDLTNAGYEYSEAVRTTSIQLADENEHLATENQKLQINSSGLGFIKEFASFAGSACNLVELTEKLVCLWQKYYQTGPVCLYLISEDEINNTASLAKESSECETFLARIPGQAVSQFPGKNFAIIDANKGYSWLLEQTDVNFELSKTKLMPLHFAEKLLGIIVFELRHPVQKSQLEERFKPVCDVVTAFLNVAISRNNQEYYAEQFSGLVKWAINKPIPGERKTEQQIESPETASGDIFEMVTETAAGAAHELNNPLSVISGRAQLLSDNEKDPEKKKILIQIKQNAEQVTGMVDDLMKFAKPQKPRPARVQIKKLLDDAIMLASEKTHKRDLEIQMVVPDSLENAIIDPSQIVPAIANILCNSIESYLTKTGPIKVLAEPAESNGFVKIIISDLGCGMDSQTVRMATAPFFSAKPAGRKRGMGLAIANRLIQLNGGSLNISSRPAEGTTVTILLPAT